LATPGPGKCSPLVSPLFPAGHLSPDLFKPLLLF
jgi:hypothetical protein